MSKGNQSIWNSTTLATVTGIGFCFLAAKYRSQILRQFKLLVNYKDPLRNQEIHIISNVDECRAVMRHLKAHCKEYNVLGFDCEWVTVGGARRPVALLQLASHRGLCALVRLCNLQMIPIELREILQDDNIIKVGVQPCSDAAYLAKDYGVCVASTLDLRYLAVECGYRPGGLAQLSMEHLKVQLDKNWRVRCSDWEAETLMNMQIEYAAKDAHVGVELFRKFADKLKPKKLFENHTKHLKAFIDEYCFKYLDASFSGGMVHRPNMKGEQSSKSSLKKTTKELAEMKGAKLMTRSKPLYDNCFLQAPDGELLCTCDSGKANWYIKKGIGELVTESPLTVRLNFEPAGRAVGQTGMYYLTAKENHCVVCGYSEKYVRKNVVPREYRKYFPTVMKDHTSHDVLLLCPPCHQKSNISDLTVRGKLAEECDAPIASGAAKTVEIPRLRELKSISRALLNQRDQIPIERKNELQSRLQELCPDVEEISDEFLKSYTDIETSEMNENYNAHGAKVVEYYQNSDQGLVALERLWREHFVNVMQPKHLPDLWSLEHNVQRLEVRAAEGRIDEGDLKLAGLQKQ